MRHLTTTLALVLAFATVAPADAQRTRSGFWASAGAGVGSVRVDDDQRPDRKTGTGLLLRLGNSPDPRVSVGGEVNAYVMSNDSTDINVLSVMGVVLFHPVESAGLFFSGGIGLFKSEFDYDLAPAGQGNVKNRATGIQLGTGYDIALVRGLSLTPYLLYLKSFAGGTTEFDGSRIDEEISPDYFQFGIGLTWH